MTHRGLLLTAMFLLCLPGASAAQDASHWGVIGSVTPQWKVPTQLEDLFEGTVDIKGTDFSVGIARGRWRSGDWGVSYIRKRFKDGSRVEKIEQDCNFSNGCFLDGDSFTTRGVAINGLEVHKFIPFVRIRDRVQIGMNVAGGFGKFTGVLDKREFSADPVSFPPGGGRPTGRQTETSSTEPATELIDIPVFPIFKLQASVAVIASPAFKLRFQGGIDLPGYEFVSIAAVYLIGGK